jgi:hypothetical protein
MVSHLYERLALFLYSATSDQKELGINGQSMQPDFLLVATFAERSALLLAMANLLNSAGRQVQPGLSAARRLPLGGSYHAATFTRRSRTVWVMRLHHSEMRSAPLVSFRIVSLRTAMS